MTERQPEHQADILVAAEGPGRTRSGAERVQAIDVLRGLVISIMVLDHVRDFFHFYAPRFDPTDPLKTTPILYATRWITHLCAPTFVFLAGVAIFLQMANGKRGGERSGFLFKRGAWLILLELTVVSFGFNFGWPMLFLQVIFAIGAGMICMSLLCRLPVSAVLAIGVALVALSPLFLPAAAAADGATGLVLALVLSMRVDPGVPMIAVYPVLPWLGVMCLGFGMGPLFHREPADRMRWLLAIGAAAIAAFLLLRLVNGYGDPAPWQPFARADQTIMSFLRVSKYPPSPDFVLITLGLSFLLFTLLEKLQGPLASVLVTFGRTPLFTYICHVYIAHGLMLLAALATGYPAAAATDFLLGGNMVKHNWGVSLGITYLVWLAVLAMLYPLSRWFEGVKRRRRDWWLGYV